MADPTEIPWIAHLLWLQAGTPDTGPNEFLADARWIAERVDKVPSRAVKANSTAVTLGWSCTCGTDGEIRGEVTEAGRQVLQVHALHTGQGHEISIHREADAGPIRF